MELSVMGFVLLFVLYLLFKPAIKCWIRIIEKLSAKAEGWVDSIDLNKQD